MESAEDLSEEKTEFLKVLHQNSLTYEEGKCDIFQKDPQQPLLWLDIIKNAFYPIIQGIVDCFSEECILAFLNNTVILKNRTKNYSLIFCSLQHSFWHMHMTRLSLEYP